MSAALSPRRDSLSLPIVAVLLGLLAYGSISSLGLIGRWGGSLAGLATLASWLAVAALAWPLVQTPPSRLRVAAVLGIALALRLAFAFLVAGRGPQGDAQSYLTLAASVRAGGGLAILEPFMGITARALFPPLYPIVLAGWSSVFGTATLSLLALSTLIDGATAAVMLAFAARLGRAATGRGAAWLYLIWPSVLLSAPLAQKESLCALLVVTLAAAWAWGGPPGWRRIVLLGVAAGLLALTQPGEAPLAALFGLVLIRQFGLTGLLRAGVPAAGVAAVVLAPWWIRNWLVLGTFVPLTTSSGVGLWIGNNPDATGNWMPPPATLRGLPELEYGRQASAIARMWIVGHPLEFVRLTLAKLARSGGVAQFGLVRLYAMHPAPAAWVGALLFPLSQGAHLLMLGGAAVAARVRFDRALAMVLLLVAACGLQMALFGAWFEFGERHREFATPFLLLLICLALDRQRSAATDQRRVVPG